MTLLSYDMIILLFKFSYYLIILSYFLISCSYLRSYYLKKLNKQINLILHWIHFKLQRWFQRENWDQLLLKEQILFWWCWSKDVRLSYPQIGQILRSFWMISRPRNSNNLEKVHFQSEEDMLFLFIYFYWLFL